MEVAIIIPCYNEELTIEKVIKDFRKELPDAKIYVIDNNSRDSSVEKAQKAGAIVRRECRQGKGFVLQRVFSEVIADIYVLVDGDDTYNAADVHRMIEPVVNGEADITVAIRLDDYRQDAFRSMHVLGNHLITRTVNSVFGSGLKDVLSGFRVLNKRFAKSIPISSRGFEIETEITLQGLRHGFVFKELISPYKERPEGSVSKLSTYRDGFRILTKIVSILINYRPLKFFGSISAFFLFLSLATGSVVIYEYLKYSYIYRVPTTIFAAGTMLLSGLNLFLGILLDVINRKVRDIEYLVVVKR